MQSNGDVWNAMKRTLLRVWDQIGADVFAAGEETELSRATVIEIVLDAGRADEAMKRGGYAEFWTALGDAGQAHMAEEAFKYERYCN